MSTIIGIDLGTTYSVAAYLAPEGPRLIPNALGDTLTPSVVGIDDDGKLLVGYAAKEYRVLHPERCASVFKRYMGSGWTVTLDKREFTMTECFRLPLTEPIFGFRMEFSENTLAKRKRTGIKK